MRCIGWDTFHAVRPTLCTALLVLAAGPALAGAPQQRVRQTVDAVSAAVNDPQLQGSSNERERRERVAKAMRESFDFRGMAQESLGSHWASLTPEQRDRFVGLFAKLFERSYDRLVLRFLGGSSTTYGAESVEPGRASVKTVLIRKGGDELPVDYRLTADGGAWKISDVVVDGVSLAGNFRAQFDKTIRASSYDGLVQRIETKLAEEQ
jgi:phospholipid transport system substrate-binding protein